MKAEENINIGDLFYIGHHLAIVMGVGEADISFVYLNRHVPGTAKYEMWKASKKAIRMSMVSSK